MGAPRAPSSKEVVVPVVFVFRRSVLDFFWSKGLENKALCALYHETASLNFLLRQDAPCHQIVPNAASRIPCRQVKAGHDEHQ